LGNDILLLWILFDYALLDLVGVDLSYLTCSVFIFTFLQLFFKVARKGGKLKASNLCARLPKLLNMYYVILCEHCFNRAYLFNSVIHDLAYFNLDQVFRALFLSPQPNVSKKQVWRDFIHIQAPSNWLLLIFLLEDLFSVAELFDFVLNDLPLR